MKRLGPLLIVVGLVGPAIPTVYSMMAAFNSRTEPNPKLIDMGMRLSMIGLPVAVIGVVLVAISLVRRTRS